MDLRSMAPIEGVQIIPKKRISDDRGSILLMLRKDDPEYENFGEVYFSKIYAGVVKGWHLHNFMTVNYYVVVGAIRLALYDDRSGSVTKGCLQEIYLDEADPKLITIPPGIWNGFKGLGNQPSILANCATLTHDPSEMSRRTFDDPFFQYNWEHKNG